MNSITWPSRSRRPSVHPICQGLLLASLLFLPGALGYTYQASSFATGTAAASMLTFVLVAFGQIPLSARQMQIALGVAGIVSFITIAHLILAVALSDGSDFDFDRAYLSLLLVALILLSAPAIAEALMVSDEHMTFVLRVICFLFILSALFALAKIQPYTESLGDKPTYPYTEPSFYGFSVPAILIFNLIRLPKLFRVCLVGLFLAIGYALGNFTIIAACALAAATSLPISWITAGGIIGVLGSSRLDLSYYADRLNFDWANSTNLSALVYVQGWQMLEEALRKTYAWGLGFQQLGIGYTNVPASMRINVLLGRDANLQDGGFILSKLGGEFGLVGLALVAGYFYVAGKSFLKLRRAARVPESMSNGDLFAHACIVGYAVEMVVRGTNYFTGTLVLLLAALFYLAKFRRNLPDPFPRS